MLPFKNVALESFGLEATLGEGKATLRLSGTGDMLAVEPLKRCLNELRVELLERHIQRLEVDMQSLYLLNSSCIKAFVSMVYSIQSAGHDLRLKFMVDKNLSWQARTIAPLARMAPEVVSVSLYPKAASDRT